MAILEETRTRLTALGLHCAIGSDVMFQDSEITAILRVSTSAQAVDETIVGSSVVTDYIHSPAGRKRFDERLAELHADDAIGKAMYTPGAEGA
jgi:hypothetical protein